MRAVNEYGIAGELAAEYDLTVSAAPETAIVAGPSNPTARTTAAFAFTSTEPGSTFVCYLDGVELGECLSPAMFPDIELDFPSITLGTHTFQVAAEDLDGNVDPTPASWTWTVVEGSAPDTVISGGPDDPTTETSASFGFFSTEQDSTFLCSLDGADPEVCTSPAQYTGLVAGRHVFQVVATGPGRHGPPTPASFSWTIGPPETEGPSTVIVDAPPAVTQSTMASFMFSSPDAVRFECALDGEPFVECTSPRGYNALTDGVHTFAVRGIDASGNTESPATTHTWRVDRDPPQTSLVQVPPVLSSSGSARFTFSSEPGATFQCSIDAGPLTACESPKDLHDLLDGPHTFVVRAVDAAGNADSSPASHSWTVERVASETTITSGPSSLTRSTDATFEFASEPGVTFECSVDNAAYATCTSPASYTGLAAGDHAFAVRSTDAAGNVDPTPATSTWTIDLAPVATVRRRPGQPDRPLVGEPALLVERARRHLRVLARRRRLQLVRLACRAHGPHDRHARVPRPRGGRPRCRSSPRSTRGRSCRGRRRRSTRSCRRWKAPTSRPRARASA